MKNQYIAIMVLITFSIIACGNSIEESTSVKEAVMELEDKKTDSNDSLLPKHEEESIIEGKNEEQKTETALESTELEDVVEEKETEIIAPIEEETASEEPMAVEIVRPNHGSWDGLTKKYVSAAGKVNYKGMKTNLPKIKTYLEHLNKTSPKKDWSKNEKLAYWINLYNASTVHLIASNYPTSSITKLSGGKPWDKKFVKSGTKVYSLNDIENTIVRPQFKDPRIHAALNCAAVSCPKLLNGAFLPSRLNAQLDKQTRAWINDKTKNKLSGNKAQVSQIFDWYKVDFKGGVVAFINKYISTGVALESNAKITYLEYDWALNE